MRIISFLIVALLIAAPATVWAQDHRPYSEGDGRIHGGPLLQVDNLNLMPGQVQTINLWPGFHTVLEFPFPVARIDGGVLDIFAADHFGNKVTLKATDVDVMETSMTITLGDENLTVIPFLVRIDESQPMAYVVRFSDHWSHHRNRAEADIARRLESNVNERVEVLAEEHLRQRMMFGDGAIRINRSGHAGSRADRVTFHIDSAQQLPGPDGGPRLYIRYVIRNDGRAPIRHFFVQPEISEQRRRWIVLSSRRAMPLSSTEEVASSSSVPAGGSVRGMVILDGVTLTAGQALDLSLIWDGGEREVVVPRVLVGQR